jgi:hypothetical protein
MQDTIQLLDVVALLAALPQSHLKRGAIGTVVEYLAPDVWLVEFSDDDGEEYATLELSADQLMRLHHEPATEDATFGVVPA